MTKPKPKDAPRLKRGRKNLTPDFDRVRARFLELISKNANICDAAKACNMDITTFYRRRRMDETFAQEWEESMQVATDRARAACYERGVLGMAEPVHSGGKLLGKKKVYSDRLLELWLRAHDPAFREKVTLGGNVAATVSGAGENGAVLIEHTATALVTSIIDGIAAAKAHK